METVCICLVVSISVSENSIACVTGSRKLSTFPTVLCLISLRTISNFFTQVPWSPDMPLNLWICLWTMWQERIQSATERAKADQDHLRELLALQSKERWILHTLLIIFSPFTYSSDSGTYILDETLWDELSRWALWFSSICVTPHTSEKYEKCTVHKERK